MGILPSPVENTPLNSSQFDSYEELLTHFCIGSDYMTRNDSCVLQDVLCVTAVDEMEWGPEYSAAGSYSNLWLSWSRSNASVSPLGPKQTATIKTGWDPWENTVVFVPSDHNWMVIIEWKQVWWFAVHWGNWAQSGAAVPPPALSCL